MNYQRIYNQIIDRAKNENRKKYKNIYYEQHHIIPKCMGGNENKKNLILLTAREHFIVHWLLIRIYADNRKLAHAFWAMCNLKGNVLDNRIMPSSRTYSEAKEHRSNLGMSEEQKQKLRKPKRDSSKMGKHDKHGTKNPFYGKTHSAEAKQKMRNAIKENRKDGWLPGNAKPVEIDGIQYRCLAEAAAKTGIGNSLIIYRIKSNNFKYISYKYIN
jgi:hypothetical protein